MPQRRLVDNGDLGSSHTMSITNGFSLKFHGPWRWVSVCTVMALTACGGGSASDQVPSTLGNVVGAWKDNTSMRPTLAALILPSGAYWAFYDNIGGRAGFAQGNASATGTNFRASAKEYPNDYTTSDVSISAEMSNGALNGSRTVGNTSPQSFALLRIPSTDFLAPQVQVSDIYGEWADPSSGFPDQLLVPVGSSGPFYGKHGSSGCDFAVTLIPQNNAYAYDTSLAFTGSLCTLPRTTNTGIAMVFKINNGAQKRMLIAVKSSDQTQGWLFSLTQ